MLDFVLRLIGALAVMVAHHPVTLVPLVFLYLVGSMVFGRKMTPAGIRASYGRLGNIVIGAMVLIGGATWLYEHRRNVGRMVLVLTCASAAAVWALAVEMSPQGWLPVVIIGGCLAFIAAAVWARRVIGDREFSEFWEERWRHDRVAHAADVVLAGTTVGPLAAEPDGSFTAPVHLPAGARLNDLEPEKMGTALSREGLPVDLHHVEVTPAAKAGHGTLYVSSKPRRPTWDIMADIDNRLTLDQWAAMVSDDPADEIPLGPSVDLHTGAVDVVRIPVGFPHVLIGGVTGAGKSAGMVPMIGGSARKRHTQQILLDPLGVEFSPWAPRALEIARTPRECYEALRKVLRLMDARQQVLTERGKRKWRVGIDGCHVDVFLDEMAAITTGRHFVNLPLNEKGEEMTAAQFCARNIDAIRRITSQSRKWGIRLWAATQRPDHKVFEDTGPRDNFDWSVAYRHKSRRGARMTTGESDFAPDATQIPRSVRGGCYVGLETDLYVAARPFLLVPRQHVSDPDEIITAAAEEIAAETAHLRNPQLTYELEPAA